VRRQVSTENLAPTSPLLRKYRYELVRLKLCKVVIKVKPKFVSTMRGTPCLEGKKRIVATAIGLVITTVLV
jgi:hypothetical protein